MRVLIGCEESQKVCQAFRLAGHNAYSCDLQPTRGNPRYHYQQDIMEVILDGKWDLIILHPDCTAMAVSGNRHYAKGTPGHDKRLCSVAWTMKLWELAVSVCDRVILENPKSVIFPHLRKMGADIQYIQPYEFGHMETKSTGFALHGVPRLKETDNVYTEMMKLSKKERHKVWYMSPGENRKRDRSETYPGIADAMATQWNLGECIDQPKGQHRLFL